MDYPNMWIYGRWALRKVPRIKWKWSRMWNIGKMFCCIYKDHYCLKVQLFWRSFGFQAIGGLIILRLHWQPWWTLLILKIQFEFRIMGQKTWNLWLHTCHLEILMLEILCSWNYMILILFLSRWEVQRVMLSRMKIVNI